MKRIHHLERASLIYAPVERVYNQCLRTEDYPGIARAIVGIHPLGGSQFLWRLQIWGRRIKQRLEVYEKSPGRFIAWRSWKRHFHHGVITFEPRGRASTLVTIAIDYEPHDFFWKIWAMFGTLERRIAAVLNGLCRCVERPVPAAAKWDAETQACGAQLVNSVSYA